MSRTGAVAYLEGELVAPNGPGLDGLRLVKAPLVPKVRLHLAQDAIVWWARMEAEVGAVLTAPFWATAWPGGQAVARCVLDRPVTVAGRRVLDVASGSGLVAIAAGLAGAAVVTANDIDPYALAAITMNARANRVAVSVCPGDLLDGDGGDAEVVLAGMCSTARPSRSGWGRSFAVPPRGVPRCWSATPAGGTCPGVG